MDKDNTTEKAEKSEKKTKKTSTKKSNSASSWEKLSLKELKAELQKLRVEVTTNKEKNTSLVRKLRKFIAKKLTNK